MGHVPPVGILSPERRLLSAKPMTERQPAAFVHIAVSQSARKTMLRWAAGGQ